MNDTAVLVAIALASAALIVCAAWAFASAGRGARAPVARPYRWRGAPTVSVVIPALNEEDNIGWVLANLSPLVTEVVLVDGLSTDRTEAIARALRPDLVVVHQRLRGKGAALRAGFAASTGEIVVMLDADGSTDPRELPAFIDALSEGADFVKGSRHLHGGGSEDFTAVRRSGNRVLVTAANVLYGTSFTDLCYGYCAFWRRHLNALALTADGFEIETELVLRAVKARLRIAEVPSFELKRRSGKSNLNVFSDGRRVLATLFGERLRRVPSAAMVRLLPLEVASSECEGWRPAGHERRRQDRRRDPDASGYRGLERRGADRRLAPVRTTTVYAAAPFAAELQPALAGFADAA